MFIKGGAGCQLKKWFFFLPGSVSLGGGRGGCLFVFFCVTTPVGGIRARAAGTPSLASYCFPALRFGHSAALRTANGREANDAWLSQTAATSCPAPADRLEAMRKGDRKDETVGANPLSLKGFFHKNRSLTHKACSSASSRSKPHFARAGCLRVWPFVENSPPAKEGCPKGGVVASSSFSASQRLSAGSGQGLPELLRWPRNASRP
ncbi:hypothetical protein Dbac_0237 [Desulfomicrobium baculatum DSM 4028]|uniref:Uncharacterized protein n=1 Tax=Desulfomicrobium baculatum (strain DSM 4028 / VKM B-1378 / X) TaxID=525897 RepID=C7LTS9_DESBD|nr:hypothetical protein Dbac_0237 [Desulfomicrobium baculatum DSM 4028]